MVQVGCGRGSHSREGGADFFARRAVGTVCGRRESEEGERFSYYGLLLMLGPFVLARGNKRMEKADEVERGREKAEEKKSKCAGHL